MRMDMLDWSGDILALVAQEASALVDLLCKQNSGVLDRIIALVEPKTLDQIQSLTNNRDRVSAIVDYFKNSDQKLCIWFLSTVCQYCDNIPFLLETTLVSIAGYTSGTNFNHTCETDSSPSQHAKRPRLDHLQSYTDALKSMIMQKHESVAQAVVKNIHLEDTWVYLRHKNPPRGKDRTIQPQATLDNHEGEESEHKVSVESLLKTTSRVVMLLGQAGSGKTLLVHCLGRDWAEGSFPSIHLLFLLEFRQLNLISRNLSLKELLFLFYPASGDIEEQSDAVFAFILSNPEKVCFIFDGYDEFRGKLTHPEKLESIMDPNKPLPMIDLLSGLCSRKFLPDCTVMVTCRPRDVTDMFGSPGFITCELQGFDRLGVKEYAEQYFHKKGEELKKKAVNLLMDNRHLLSMSHVPGLCHICCVCIDHLFSSDGYDLQLPASLTQIYMQILLAFLKRIDGGVVSGTSPVQRYRTKIVEISLLALKGLEESTIVFMDTDVSPELQDFGIKSGILTIVKRTHEDGSSGYGFTFMHLKMQEFLAALHLMTNQNITESQLKKKLNLKTRWTTKIDPKSIFTDSLHLYVCGLAAEACTSNLVQFKGTEGATAWVQKRQAAVRNFLLGLAGSTSQTGPKIVELCRCAHETQDAKLARAIGSRPQFELRNIRLNAVDMDSLAFVTAAADQNVCLDIGGCSVDLDCLEILPSFKNVDHLIFRSRKYDDKFAEALCGILSQLQALRQLDFISGGLTDVGAAKLARALKDLGRKCNIFFLSSLSLSNNSLGNKGLKKILDLLPNVSSATSFVLENSFMCFRLSSLTQSDVKPVYMTKLCKQLVKCENLLDIEFSHLKLSNGSVEKLMLILPEMSSLQLLNLSHVDLSTNGALLLIRSLADCQRVTAVELRHQAEAFIKFVPEKAEAAICKLTEYKLCKSNVEKLSRILENCPHLSELDLSHNLLRDEGVKCFVDYLPKLKISSSVSLNGNRMTQVGALHLVDSMNTCEKVIAVEVSAINIVNKYDLQYYICKANLDLFLSDRDHPEKFSPALKSIRCVGYLVDCKLVVCFVLLLTLIFMCYSLYLMYNTTFVTFFSFDDCDIDGQHLAPLTLPFQKCHALQDLRFSQLRVDRNSADFFSAIVIFILYVLSQFVLGDRGAAVLGRALQSIFLSSLYQCSGWTAARGRDLVRGLVQCVLLAEIRLDSVVLDEEGITILAQGFSHLASLRRLSLNNIRVVTSETFVNGTGMLCLLTSFKDFRQMEEIELESWRMGDGGTYELVKYIPLWTELVKLSLSDNNVTDQAGEKLLAALSHCRVLQKLQLSKNRLGQACAAKLAQVLPLLPQLTELNLSENQFGPHGSLALCEGLMSMKALKILHLTSIGSSDLVGVASSLKHCPSIEDISLSWNGCGDSLAQTLAEILPLCTKLKRLDLEANNITTAGATVIAKCLPSCPSIEVIRLWRNPIAKEDENLKDQRLNFSSF
uniref:NLR family CARD domain containing 5 n=1 Tax=Cyprinus carpio TaxID=7962 RepID=A0A8C2B345_CYPCA